MLGGIMIDLSLDKHIVKRHVYSIVEWLQEIGGIAAALRMICFLMLPLIQTWTLEKFLISKLYKRCLISKSSKIYIFVLPVVSLVVELKIFGFGQIKSSNI